MTCYYFAYGSNMNPERMQDRGLNFNQMLSGYLPHLQLAFNKKAHCGAPWAYANIRYAKDSVVEGILYRLQSRDEIAKLDPYEGTPFRYSREVYPVRSPQGVIPAWVYIANRGNLQEGLQPARWYLDHLLAGEPYLSEDYFAALAAVQCLSESQA